MVIHQATGDRRWLESPYRPSRTRGLSDNDDGGLPPQVLEQVQEAGVDVLRHLQSDGDWAISKPSSDLVAEMLGVCVGEPVAPMYGQMFSEELYRLTANGSGSSRTPEVPPGFSALIIGAGVSGIVAAHQLGQLGVPFTIVDAHDAPGGNWLDNPYPGAGVDTPSHLYSFSFAPYDWTRHFVLRAELQAYFASAFKTAGAAAHARFETTVESAVFDESDARWTVTLRGPDGVTDVLRPNVLVSAVGVLNRPKIPPVAGRTRFIGRQFHSSQWPADLELEGKTIAVVGTGASAMQIVPAIVDRAGSVQVVQRTPAWVAPFEKFEVPISDDARQLLQSFPLYRSWYWLKLYWQFGDKVLEALRKDPDWPFPDRAVNARNDGHRKYFT